jgi:hypothetical protein
MRREDEATSHFAAEVVINWCSAKQSTSSDPALRRLLDLPCQFLDYLDRHALDIHHFAAQPAAEADRD